MKVNQITDEKLNAPQETAHIVATQKGIVIVTNDNNAIIVSPKLAKILGQSLIAQAPAYSHLARPATAEEARAGLKEIREYHAKKQQLKKHRIRVGNPRC